MRRGHAARLLAGNTRGCLRPAGLLRCLAVRVGLGLAFLFASRFELRLAVFIQQRSLDRDRLVAKVGGLEDAADGDGGLPVLALVTGG